MPSLTGFCFCLLLGHRLLRCMGLHGNDACVLVHRALHCVQRFLVWMWMWLW